MKITLKDYIKESLEILESLGGTSDDDLLYRLGIYYMNTLQKDKLDKIKKEYKISKPYTYSHIKSKVLKYMKDKMEPIIDKNEELIPRSEWDLDTLYGETEFQLMHPSFLVANDRLVKKLDKKHDILTIFQCSAKKPYYDNHFMKFFKERYGDYTDFACFSEPGIIPFEFSSHYPYRYDEWQDQVEQKLPEEIDITHKHRIVNMCRFLKFIRETGYKKVITFIPNRFRSWLFEECIKHNIERAKSWLQMTITPGLITSLEKEYPQLAGGLLTSRLSGLPQTRKRYKKLLKGVVDSEYRDEIDDIEESVKDPKYKLLDNISYSDIISKFKDQFKQPNSDKEEGYYKSYYWSCLDILLIGLDGNLLKDIDKTYFELMKSLDKDNDWEKFDEFLFVYKPSNKSNIPTEKFHQEALDMGLVREKFELELV